MNQRIKFITIIVGVLITRLNGQTYQSYAINYPYSYFSYLLNSRNQFTEQNSPNPDESGTYIEGDIVLPPEMQIQDYESEATPTLWSDKKIPYKISSEICELF